MLSACSTSPSSSDDEDFKLQKLSFSQIPRTRSHSISETNLDKIPEANIEEETEEKITRGRRGSLPANLYKLSSSRVLSPTSLDAFHDKLVGSKSYKARKHLETSISLDRDVILEESEQGEQEVSPKVQLMLDKKEEALSKKKKPIQLHESIQEELGEDERKIFKHDDFFKKLQKGDTEFPGSPKAPLISFFAESIQEEEEGHEIQLKHEKFLKKISQKNEHFLSNPEPMMSSLQEVDEEEDDQTEN